MNKVLLTAILTCLHTVYSCFWVATAAPNSFVKGHHGPEFKISPTCPLIRSLQSPALKMFSLVTHHFPAETLDVVYLLLLMSVCVMCMCAVVHVWRSVSGSNMSPEASIAGTCTHSALSPALRWWSAWWSAAPNIC